MAAPWVCGRTNGCMHGKAVEVFPGDTISTGVNGMNMFCVQWNPGYCYDITVSHRVRGSSSIRVFDYSAQVVAYGGAVESAGLTQCSQFTSGALKVRNIALTQWQFSSSGGIPWLLIGTGQTPSWSFTPGANYSLGCGFGFAVESPWALALHHN